MDNPGRVAKNLQAFRIAVSAHDRENDCTASGIGLSPFDADRLGFDDGEQLWAGITLQIISVTTGNFRVLCDGEHDQAQQAEHAEVTRAVGVEA